MNYRSDDAEANRAAWETLLSEAEKLSEEAKDLQHRNQHAIKDIQRKWDNAAEEVMSAAECVGGAAETHRSMTDTIEKFGETDASRLPASTTDVPSVHDDPTELPVVTNTGDVPSESAVRDQMSGHSKLPEAKRDRPVPFTERSWFALHSDRFPFGEAVFAENEDANNERRGSDDPDRRHGDRRDDAEGENRHEDAESR